MAPAGKSVQCELGGEESNQQDIELVKEGAAGSAGAGERLGVDDDDAEVLCTPPPPPRYAALIISARYIGTKIDS